MHLHRHGLQSAPWQQPQRPCSAAGGKPAQEGGADPLKSYSQGHGRGKDHHQNQVSIIHWQIIQPVVHVCSRFRSISAAFIRFNLGPESESFICTTPDKSAFISLDQYNFRTDPLTYFTSVQSCSFIYNILCDPYFALSHFIVFPDNRELTVPHINSKHGCNKVTQGTQEMIN